MKMSLFRSASRSVFVTAGSVMLLLLGFLSPGPSAVLAHSGLLKSEPPAGAVLESAPSRVIAWFTERPDPRDSEISVLNSSGTRVDNRDTRGDPDDRMSMIVSLPSLPDGRYTVSWSAVSAVDGHAERGSFVFTVGKPVPAAQQPVQAAVPPQSPAPVEDFTGAALKWFLLMGLLALVGSFVFELLVWGPVLRAQKAAGEWREVAEALARRYHVFRWLALIMVVAASVGQLWLRAAVSSSDITNTFQALGSPMWSVVTNTEWGHLWVWRIALVVGIGVVLVLAVRHQRHESAARLAALVTPIILGSGALLTLSLVSHGAGLTEVRGGAVFSDYLHLVAASFWAGGLFSFVTGFSIYRKCLSAEQCRSTLSALVPRFSRIALMSVGVLVVSGMYVSWANVGSLDKLATPYGLVLLGKLALFGFLMALGALNMRWVSQLLKRDFRGVTWLNRLVRTEVTLVVLVLLSVGLMTNMATARQSSTFTSGSISVNDKIQNTDVALRVTPGRAGPNDITLTLKDARTGRSITNASQVSLELHYLSRDLGENSVSASRDSGRGYVARDVNLSVAGPWHIDLAVTRPDGFDIRGELELAIPAQAAAQDFVVPSRSLGRIFWGVELIALGLMFGLADKKINLLVAGLSGVAILAGGLLIVFSQG